MSAVGYKPSQITRLVAPWPVTYIRPGMVSLGAVCNSFSVWLPFPRGGVSPSGADEPGETP